ncbi:hypothetical protein ACTPEM_25915, partial [Clostridioides difficile]
LENGDKLKKGDRLTLLDSKNSGSLTAVGNSYAAGIGGGDTENAYIIALLINQVGSLVLGTGGSIAGAIISIFIAVAVVFVVLTY